MNLRIQVPGRSYSAIDLVLEPLQHTLWGFWVRFGRRVAHLCFILLRRWRPKSDRRPVWRRRRFFISSVEDSVLVRCAALESLCYGIGFSRFELNLCYTFSFYFYKFYIVLCSLCICILPYDFFGNQTAAHPVVEVCACG